MIPDDELSSLLRRAVLEDLGPMQVDATSEFMIAEDAQGEAAFVAREHGVPAGLAVLPAVAMAFGACDVELLAVDGGTVEPGDELAVIRGPLRDLLRTERTALNLLSHLSGIATLTRAFVEAVAGTSAVICETRKTLPGLRHLQKYAAACGGATPHRVGLYDAMLIKDNHLGDLDAAADPDTFHEAVVDAAERARMMIDGLKFVEVEVDTLQQMRALLSAPEATLDYLLLDNMTPEHLREAVGLRDAHRPKWQLEASGGITLETVREVATTGVDRISVGALTHSVRALDIGLDLRA